MTYRRFVFAADGRHAYYGQGNKAERLATDPAYLEIPADQKPPVIQDGDNEPLWQNGAWVIPPLTSEEESNRQAAQGYNWARWRLLVTKVALGQTLTAQQIQFLERGEKAARHQMRGTS